MNYAEVYKVVLDFHRKYSKVQGSDEYWQSVVDESEQIFNRYNKHEFVKALLLAVINELERKSKAMKEGE